MQAMDKLRDENKRLRSLLEELAQMAEDDAVIFGQGSAWRPFYMVHAEKIRAALKKGRK